MPPRIFLTGMMGSGKTSAGLLLAEALGYVFVDLDRVIEKGRSRTIAELFADGEERFREIEMQALGETLRRQGVVVATGGGTLLGIEAMDRARNAGTVVYLRAPAGVLARRLEQVRDRPLLLQDGRPLTAPALRRRVSGLLKDRRNAYMRADLVVDVADMSPTEVAHAILAELGRHRASRNERR